MNKLTADTITIEQIDSLRCEAAAAGDHAQVDICNRAMGSDPELEVWARGECADVINAARAQED